jgi:hypothetical protein
MGDSFRDSGKRGRRVGYIYAKRRETIKQMSSDDARIRLIEYMKKKYAT